MATSKVVRTWASPYLYKTVVLPTSKHLRCFAALMRSSSTAVSPTVRHLWVGNPDLSYSGFFLPEKQTLLGRHRRLLRGKPKSDEEHACYKALFDITFILYHVPNLCSLALPEFMMLHVMGFSSFPFSLTEVVTSGEHMKEGIRISDEPCARNVRRLVFVANGTIHRALQTGIFWMPKAIDELELCWTSGQSNVQEMQEFLEWVLESRRVRCITLVADKALIDHRIRSLVQWNGRLVLKVRTESPMDRWEARTQAQGFWA
ncbi:hypothetical protein BOTBODRAFT_608333 [Botryobasidium botryosum FD-172 SS1]|uniref:Uncharacterized protein n=1 Tax=Botryobasidium botryosum (strain FD-172 SS1) TaxID=930990 RepID=A0A067M7J4_BOTB1|nr:hypothetical protein BOTBODRAFT_608333 [Botryobasidium botryosum FD-172 SS1]